MHRVMYTTCMHRQREVVFARPIEHTIAFIICQGSLVYSNLFYVDGPTGSKAVFHIEGASQRVTGLNLDQWTSR